MSQSLDVTPLYAIALAGIRNIRTGEILRQKADCKQSIILRASKGKPLKVHESQGLQILLISGVTVTSASQILESFWKIWSQVSQRKKPFADFTALGPGMNNYRDGYTV